MARRNKYRSTQQGTLRGGRDPAPLPERVPDPPGPFWRRHAGILILTAVAALLILPNLGGTYLWADEGDTAVLAANILVNGVPSSWDGVTFTESDVGMRLNSQMVQVVHPWVPYYLTAASIAVFGETSFAARFPFAVAGILTIPMVYALLRRLGSDRRTAYVAIILLLLSVQFLLYSRQCRHYAVNMLLSTTMVYLALDLDKRRGCALFGLAAVALFHTHPVPSLSVLAAIGFLTLVWRPFWRFRKGFWLTFPVVMLFTLPWLTLAVSGMERNSEFPWSFDDVLYRLWQFAIEAGEFVPLMLWLALPFVWRKFSPSSRAITILIGTVLAALVATTIATQGIGDMYLLGLRYSSGLLPLGACITAVIVVALSFNRIWISAALVALISFTHLPGMTLTWLVLDDVDMTFGQLGPYFHVPPHTFGKFLRRETVAYLPELWAANPGTIELASRYLDEHAKPGDLVISNYESEPLYYHTHLPQSLSVLPKFPAYDLVKKHGLPEYVTSVKGTRWIVWRHQWEGYNAYLWKDVLAELQRQGAKVELVQKIPETGWENRESVHYRRFPYDGFLYLVVTHPTASIFPKWTDTEIYRVEWPDKTEAPASNQSPPPAPEQTPPPAQPVQPPPAQPGNPLPVQPGQLPARKTP